MPVSMSAKVRAAIGPQNAADAQNGLAGGGSCITCNGPISPTDDASLMLGLGPGGVFKTAWYAHAACADSEIIDLPQQAVDAILTPAEGHDMKMTAAMLAYRPVLIAEFIPQVSTYPLDQPGAEASSAFMQAVLSKGFGLISHPDQEMPTLLGWLGALAPHGRATALTIMEPDGTRFFTGAIEPPAGWQRAVLHENTVLLLAGNNGLTSDEGTDEAGSRALDTAARNGRVAGGLLNIGRATDFANLN